MLDLRALERPASPEEAVRVFAEAGGACLYVAGGTVVVPAASRNLDSLIDLTGTGLSYVREVTGETGRAAAIGATTRVADLAVDPLVGGLAGGLLRDAARAVATHTVRNRATLGGNLVVSGYPTDLPTALLAMDASVAILDRGGQRVVALDEFYERRSSVFRKGDLITEIRVPLRGPELRGAFEKVGRKRVDVAIVNCGVCLEIVGDRVRGARIAVGAIGASPVRVRPAEESLVSRQVSLDAFADAAQSAADAIDPRSDHRASGGYRRKVAAVLLRRALTRAGGLDRE
jgi:carbon-monoxide dehydrogenase medium subunit